MSNLDLKISDLSSKYLQLAEEILKEAIRIPADFVDKPLDQGGDPNCEPDEMVCYRPLSNSYKTL